MISAIVFCGYLVLLVAIIDTLLRHKFHLNWSRKQINLLLFYFLAICVCGCRFISVVNLFFALLLDNNLDYYNYGFYAATFSIILIAIYQLHSIITATLRTRFFNKLVLQTDPSEE